MLNCCHSCPRWVYDLPCLEVWWGQQAAFWVLVKSMSLKWRKLLHYNHIENSIPVCSLSASYVPSVMSYSLWTYGLYPTRILHPLDSPGKNTGVVCHAFLQGIFPTQGLKLCLLSLPALAGRLYTTSTTREALIPCIILNCFQSLSHIQLFATPWTAARQASLSFSISQS